MRVLVYLLVAANLVYLAWAGWIDAPAPLPAVKASDPLPELVLVSEGGAGSRVGAMAAVSSALQTGSARAEQVTNRPDAGGRCISVGPFNDLAQAARGAALLRERGFDPRQRAEQGGTWEGFWVYVGGIESQAAEAKVMTALESGGIKDARAMPVTGSDRRVSVGLFSERERAEKRAQAVKRLGFSPEISERQQTGTVYWVDLDVGDNERAVPTEGLLSLESAGSRIEVRVCPADATDVAPTGPLSDPRDALPAATTADARVPRPG